MKRFLFLSFLLPIACLDFLKEQDTDEEEEEEEEGERQEGEQVGDCDDGVDNDEDGDVDCDDSGCFNKPACEDSGIDWEDSGDIEEPDPTLEDNIVTWGSSYVSLDLYVENGLSGAEYYWGIVETSGDCVANDWCWTGEDCFMGYDMGDGSSLSYCHPISEYGAELAYGGDATSLGEGYETVFSDSVFSSLTTHLIDDRGSSNSPCWIWGDNTSYYSGYGKTCTEM